MSDGTQQCWDPAPARRQMLCAAPEDQRAVGWGEQLCLQEGTWSWASEESPLKEVAVATVASGHGCFTQ